MVRPPKVTSTADPRLGRPALNREVVLGAALHLVDQEGLEALTMRRLAGALGHDPMALYRYANGRSALLDGVADMVLSQLVVGVGDDWPQELRRTAHAFRRLALLHPNTVPLLVTRPLATPLGLRPLGTLRPLEQVLELLTQAGFTPVGALHAYRAYIGLLHGHVLNELQELVVDPAQSDALLRLGLQRLPEQDFPRIRGLAETLLAGYDGAAELDEGLDLLLDGLTSALGSSGRRRG